LSESHVRSTSFLTFPDRGIVVAVTTNISGKDTKSIALGIAQAFADQRGKRRGFIKAIDRDSHVHWLWQACSPGC
jgi:hypothetical protein